MPPLDDDPLRDRVTAMEHALFGVGRDGGGVIGALGQLSKELHGFREEFQKLYRAVVIAAFSFVATVIGGTIVFLANGPTP
ncbi:MAG TPA: hypothetical protein VM238_03630 [Phycisphaerae bacterium]|nr:hypothetical protein [Phycisphaerae bacterium]